MVAAPHVLLGDVIRVCVDPHTAFIIDNVVHMLCHVSRRPCG